MPDKFKIEKLSFYFKDKRVINSLDLSIRANEILSVLGPANSGITTLLRTLNRLCDTDHDVRIEGDILMDGKSIFAPDISVTELRRKVGMVFEVPTPLPLSIFDNIAYGLRVGGRIGKKEAAERVEYALRTAALWDEVKDRQHIPAMSLSGGQQQRMCIARVIAMDPQVILIDRSCSGLDPISTAKIEESLSQLKERFTIILAPHNVQQAIRVSDRVAFMLMGSLVEEGTGEKVFGDPDDRRTSDYITGRFG
ncbi:MAG: phosphate ABC transporter ATP-binding protein [Oscillospiraceae bacterium]|nr:phosphate ABC transporter ATP-binding protein [Oscillospiraceae bacterium]